MRSRSTFGGSPLFETLENRLLLSASVHHAASKAHPVHAGRKPAIHAAAAKKPVVKATAAHGAATIKGDPIFMKFGTISGEVTLKGYAGDIQLNSFQWGVGRGISSPTGGSSDREASAPSVSEITITKTMDKTSPLLLKEALVGQGVSEVDIFLVDTARALGKAGTPGQPVTYAEYVLSNVMISGYSVSSGGDRPTESLSLNFTKVQFNYIPNSSTTPVSTVYDLAAARLA
ncbi:MAG TPA: type VI secretion system tube protein Hcp [Tepidisphaeraceae bacterium]|nr:type VI secretion system tube protein Hcp [Tepidisphaeraceae bacterium]